MRIISTSSNNIVSVVASININLLDSPSYTLGNAITYKMQVRSADTSVTTRVKITNGGITNGASKLILIEVAA